MANRQLTLEPNSKEKKTSKAKVNKTISANKGKSNTKKKKSKADRSGFSFKSFFKSDKTRVITGFVLMLIALFLLSACISFIGTHEADDSFFGTRIFDIDASQQIANHLGKWGMYFSFVLLKNWFGLATFGYLFLLILYAIKLITGKSLLPLIKTTGIILFVSIWVILVLATILPAEYDWCSGMLALQTVEKIENGIGSIGNILVLLFYALIFVAVCFGGNIFKAKETESIEEEAEEDGDGEDEPQKPSLLDNLKQRIAEKKAEKELAKQQLQEEQKAKEEAERKAKEEEERKIKEEEEARKKAEEEERKRQEEEARKKIEEEENRQANEVSSDIEEGVEDESGEVGVHYANLEPYDPKADLPSFQMPSLDLLLDYPESVSRTEEQKLQEIEYNKERITQTLENYKIQITDIKAIEGPTITLYEIVPAPGVRISKIKGLEGDIALSLSAIGIRIIAPMPGKGTVGIEVPNIAPQIVPIKECLSSDKYVNAGKMALPIVMGKTIEGEIFMFDLAKAPHVLMAGATGTGKSVGLNTILASLLYKKHPSELKFVLVDPKRVELKLYSKIEKHYLAKLPDTEAIITDTKKVVKTLTSLCNEMDQRYVLLENAGCRNIIEYNEKFINRRLNPEKGHRYLPYIVMVFDEFADCIMTAGREVETPVARLAQLARAVGIHLIVATQRPSVKVITGLIKANFPVRIAFKVISQMDSRTILDGSGAENLIGRGDMLYSTGNGETRIQCALIDTPEISKICDFIGAQRGYTSAFMLPEVPDEIGEGNSGVEDLDDDDEFDQLFPEAARMVVSMKMASASYLQRKFKIGYNKAGRIMDQLESAGVVGQSQGSKPREVLMSPTELEDFLQEKNLI